MKHENSESTLGPRKIKFYDIIINTTGAFISGIIGSLLLIIIIFLLGSILDIGGVFRKGMEIGAKGIGVFFPTLLTFIAFIISIIVIYLTYYFLTVTDQTKYKRTLIHFGHISFFGILTYIFITPIYLYIGITSFNNIIYVFLGHILIISFGLTLILEILNNYRYILVGFYASFISLFITSGIILLIFISFNDGYAKLLSILIILPLTNGFIIFFKGIFEYLYYEYYKITGYDKLGDIFYQLEEEEKEQLREAEEENNLF